MLFRDVLEIHKSTLGAGNLPDVLGDGFLSDENPVYRAVLAAATQAGATFAEATPKYLLMPFNQLDEIVRTRQIPYVPSARLMTEIEEQHPGVFDLEQMPIPESYHLHEAAHVVADACCAGVTAESVQERVLRAVLCESFANTVDALACGYAASEMHRMFIKQNSYMKPSGDIDSCLRHVREARGDEFTFRLMFRAYVHANFLRECPAPEAGPLQDDISALNELVEELDPLFRVVTTQNYLHLQGFEGDVDDLLSFDFAKLLERPDFAGAIAAMVEALK